MLREVERHDAKPVALRIVESDVRQVVWHQSTEQGGDGVEKITHVEMSNDRIGCFKQEAQGVAPAVSC